MIRSKWLSHTDDLNTLGVASDGCSGLWRLFLVDAPNRNRTEHKFIEDKLRPHAGGVRAHNTNRQTNITYLDISKYNNEMKANTLQKH